MAVPQDYYQRVDLTDTANGGNTALNRTGDNVREDFMNVIYNIAPTRTPFMTGIGRGKSTDVYTSWLQDTVEEPNDGNAALDGADHAATTLQRARRVGNACQISYKDLSVTGRANVVNKAGRSNEMNYQLALASKALKRDMEVILTGNVDAELDLNGLTPPKLGGLNACFRDAVEPEADTAIRGDTGSNGGVGTDGLPDAATPGTLRPFTQTLLDQVIENLYTNGGDADTIMVSPPMKRVISNYLFTSSSRTAMLYSDVGQKKTSGGATAQSAVDVYISDFGPFKIIPNRFQGYTRASKATIDDVFILDMSMWATLYLRGFHTISIAKSGDSDKRRLQVDYSLQYKEEMGSGVIADIDKTQPMTAS